MEIFIAESVADGRVRLGEEESRHCVRVLRHRAGDEINVIDGEGRLFRCVITAVGAKDTEAQIVDIQENWGGHPYHLTMAVCPTKNPDRFEWFLEKACEIGVDAVIPLIGEHSERRVFKPQRAEKILASAAKQSLKGRIPVIAEQISVEKFILASAEANSDAAEELRLIACCFEDEEHPRTSIKKVLDSIGSGEGESAVGTHKLPKITVLIGPEGDFSEKEVKLAVEHGFVPIHLGDSRLRTETAALYAVAAVYTRFL